MILGWNSTNWNDYRPFKFSYFWLLMFKVSNMQQKLVDIIIKERLLYAIHKIWHIIHYVFLWLLLYIIVNK